MKIVPFKPRHLWDIRLQPAQVNEISYVSDAYALALAESGPCISAVHNGQIIASCGVARGLMNGGVLWGFVSADAGQHMLRLDRYLRRFLGVVTLPRIEATVASGFTPGCRWLEMLDFQFEGVMRKYGPDGSDHMRYARVI